ncbi:MFS transporter, partial [Rothia mucilaginosa]
MRRTTDPSPEHPESPASRIPTNTPDATAKPTSATPLNARGQLTLLTAQVSDALASSIQAIAMPLLTYGATGDLAHSAIVMVVEAVPVILFAPFAGAIADKFNRKTLTVSFRLASAALLIASPALYAAAGLPAFLTIAFLVSTFGTFSSPAASAAMPSLLGDDYQKYMARRGSLIFLAQTLGPTIAAAVASFTTPALAVGFAGTLNLLAALTVATIRNYDLTHAERTATVQEHHTGRLLREGAAYTAHNPIVRGMLTFWFLSIAAVPITTLPMLEYLTRGLGHDYTAFGIATSVYAAGCVISSWLSAKLGVGTGAGRVRMTKRGWMCISGLGYGAVCL